MDKHSPLSCSVPSLATSINGGSASTTALDLLQPPTPAVLAEGGSVSNAPLSPGGDSSGHEFLNGAQDMISRLTAALRVLTYERERLRLVIEAAAETASLSSRGGNAAINAGKCSGKNIHRDIG